MRLEREMVLRSRVNKTGKESHNGKMRGKSYAWEEKERERERTVKYD